MKRTFLLIGFLFLLIGNSVYGYTINDGTLVGRGITKPYNSALLWTDVIGNEFNTYGIDLSQDGSLLKIDIYTDFSGTFTGGTGDSSINLVAADLFLNLDGVSGYEFAVAFSDHDSFSKGSIYSVSSAFTSKNKLEEIPGWYYGEYWHSLDDSPIVQIETGSNKKDATLADYFPIALQSHEADYLWSLTIDLLDFNVDYKKDIGIFWATATCANDIIEGTAHVNPVPEPATMLLLGSGLIGLAGFGRKKFLKKG
jgi:hypothetical protein